MIQDVVCKMTEIPAQITEQVTSVLIIIVIQMSIYGLFYLITHTL